MIRGVGHQFLVQRFFRTAVLGVYGDSCSFCGVNMPELLTASHETPPLRFVGWRTAVGCENARRFSAAPQTEVPKGRPMVAQEFTPGNESNKFNFRSAEGQRAALRLSSAARKI